MGLDGRVELLSTEYARGWAQRSNGKPAYVYAVLNGEVIGTALADQSRPDLRALAEKGAMDAQAFCIPYNKSLDAGQVSQVSVKTIGSEKEFAHIAKLKIDRFPLLRIFIFGSPRSGTSELGNTLKTQLNLPWLGEGHAAPLFARAAASLAGDPNAMNGLVRFMAEQNYPKLIIEHARTAYYSMHGSASFLDKTPGTPTILAAPFLYACFPDAKFISLRRNGISNVLSRMAKFGGSFEQHCMDWVGAVTSWEKIRGRLPHYLELQQEDMLDNPDFVAAKIATYVGVPEAANGIAESLKSGTMERTGAGLRRTSLADTDWTETQIATFRKICDLTMEKFGY